MNPHQHYYDDNQNEMEIMIKNLNLSQYTESISYHGQKGEVKVKKILK